MAESWISAPRAGAELLPPGGALGLGGDTTRQRWSSVHPMSASLPHRGLAVLLACAVATSSCSTVQSVNNSLFGPAAPEAGTPGAVGGFLGGVVADEPRAAVVGRQVLSAGGNAADAAVAVAFALAVTLPSRAGLGGGGACLAYRTASGTPTDPEAVLFVAPAPASSAGASRPAAVPMLARGMFLLQARYGSRPFVELITPAEQFARLGVPASRSLVRDVEVVGRALAADPYAAEVFFPGGRPIAEGAMLQQPDLGATLALIRTAGVGEMYQGALAKRIAGASAQAGGPFTVQDLRAALPKVAPPLVIPLRRGNSVAFPPPPADGGLAAAAAFQQLQSAPDAPDRAQAAALGAAAQWRQGGGDPTAILASPPASASMPALPASTSFATLDRNGNAVVCALSMGNLFGTGRVAPGFGVLLAASPAAVPPPLLSMAMAYNPNLRAFRAEVGASGQAAAPFAAAYAMQLTLSPSDAGERIKQDNGNMGAQSAGGGFFRVFGGNHGPPGLQPGAVPDPGRANIIACTDFLPGNDGSCGWATDPRGAGLAVGSN